MLLERGHKLRSETDTEMISHLVEEALKRGLDLAEAVRATVAQLRSSFSIVAISETEPGRLVAATTATPLVLVSAMAKTSSPPTSPRFSSTRVSPF
jgi:glucosamine--fructose-6-phosphate aminotransferase (isomerizing)